MNRTWNVSASALALCAAAGVSGTSLANDDVIAKSKDPANVVMPSITYNGWNYSTLDQVTMANVKNLSMAWTWQVGILDSHEASPLVVGDTMYIVSPKPNYVYALDLTKEGVMKWEFRPTMDVALATSQTCCGAQTRGLYYAEGKIFYATLDGQVIGLDAKSGEQLWRTVGTDITRYEGMAGNALVAGKLFIGGNEGGEGGARGKVHAYNIDTGKNAWTMYNMGPNNEVGIGARFQKSYPYLAGANPALDSWYGDSWKRGGGTSGGYFTFDPELNLFYYSTGNCGPWNPDYRREWGNADVDANGGLKAWHNNFCASQMARDATTGELVWGYAITPQDAWDIDEPLITPLIDIEIGGTMRKVAVKASRNGLFYVWDRATGKLVVEPWMHTFQDMIKKDAGGAYVNMTTGLPSYDMNKMMFTNLEDRRKYSQADDRGGANKPENYTGTEVEYCPGTAARNWENDAYSPRTKLVYTHSDNNCRAQVMVTGEYKPGTGYTLVRTAGGAAAVSKDIEGKATTLGGQLIANDFVGRKTAWSKPINDTSRTPQMATVTDLIFKGNNATGTFEAYNAATGATVWQFRTGSRFNQSPITYLGPDKKQYVAIISSSAAANTAVAANAAADNANRYRRSGTTLYVFKLPG